MTAAVTFFHVPEASQTFARIVVVTPVPLFFNVAVTQSYVTESGQGLACQKSRL